MNEFVVRLADERGRVQEQTHMAATAEELRARFTQAGYYVYSVKAKGAFGISGRKKVKLETFLVFNQQFLTLIRAGLPILGSLELLARFLWRPCCHWTGSLVATFRLLGAWMWRPSISPPQCQCSRLRSSAVEAFRLPRRPRTTILFGKAK